MRCFLFALSLTAGCFATSLGPRFYVAPTSLTIDDTTASPIIAHIDEKLMIELNARLFLGRREHLEQGACLRIAKQKDSEIWVDSTLKATVDAGSTTEVQIVFDCPKETVPIHWHVVYARDGWDQCAPSFYDVAPAFSVYRAEMLQCGFGQDSVIAWKVRPRKKK